MSMPNEHEVDVISLAVEAVKRLDRVRTLAVDVGYAAGFAQQSCLVAAEVATVKLACDVDAGRVEITPEERTRLFAMLPVSARWIERAAYAIETQLDPGTRYVPQRMNRLNRAVVRTLARRHGLPLRHSSVRARPQGRGSRAGRRHRSRSAVRAGPARLADDAPDPDHHLVGLVATPGVVA